jgi:hypothetical protein
VEVRWQALHGITAAGEGTVYELVRHTILAFVKEAGINDRSG